MTITDRPADFSTRLNTDEFSVPHVAEPGFDEEVRDDLRQLIFGDHLALHRRVRDVIASLPDQPRSDITALEQAELAPALLKGALAGLGVSAREIAADTQLRGALCDWAQITAPRLLLILTGHFDLAMGAINRHGNDSSYQQQCLSELDDASAVGVLMLTELGGTNGADQKTTAVYDSDSDGFWITTPSMDAAKFMPNVASTAVPKTVVVTARLIVGGKDEGVLPFLIRLRTEDGLADGVQVVTLPDKAGAPMDHAIIRFDRAWVPRDALLGGEWARMDDQGRLQCDLTPRQRFHRAIGVLDNGRLDLANAAIASARAALVGTANYAAQRRPSRTLMADRDSVQQDLATGLAATLAVGTLGRVVRDMRSVPSTAGDDATHVLWPMLVKPLLSDTAAQVLATCRRRVAAQGALRNNHIADWISNVEAIATAEGENRIMAATAGRSAVVSTLQLPDTPEELPWYVRMLIDRELRLAREVETGIPDPASTSRGPESGAVALATATGERLAATALVIESRKASAHLARDVIASAAAAYALERIAAHALWFTAAPQISEVAAGLRQHQHVLLSNLPLILDSFEIELPGPIFAPNYIRAWQEYTGWHDGTFPALPGR
ncbi:acyl-CoA dehydrogenase family protein [Nocardia nova]|nr:acyl-CoA dehydrogenase family protein [Nocardia nova]PPJ24948.1 hypothetical protein C5E41_21290 [Nocardia nova]